jgi:cell division protein FtsZ
MRGMGKAMMGTGEATGEKRAEAAANAAISNPLLDETSMKGARGLLISITGGHDLTLYEVDEAASRIRQEVDEDANIILGATFDSSLEGVVRVSVVATGIDPASITVDDPTSATRLEEAAARLRTQFQPKAQHAPEPVYAQERAAPVYAREEEPAASYFNETHASNGVYLEPAPRPVYSEAVDDTRAAADPIASGPYVPPAPEVVRAQRMPTASDFPKPIQDQLRQRGGADADSRKKSIFERLASFGSSRQEDALSAAATATQSRQAAPQPSPAHAEYGKRPAAPTPSQPANLASLDNHGRRAPAPRASEDDHLEIPAFLRRQANH